MFALTSLRRISRIVVGEPLSTADADHQRLPKLLALPIFSSDALSSVAYATEEILIALMAGAAASTVVSLPIALAIGVLLLVVSWSYMQTIEAYPGGGGAYLVAKDNLGIHAGLVAGAALLIDYALTVSVSVAAGVAALTSAVSFLGGHRVAIGCVVIALITIANLRGVKESGRIFAIPTYAFIGAMFLLVAGGAWAIATGQVAAHAPSVAQLESSRDLGWLLILRAFASGCSALTGVEAISNCVPQFREPTRRNAKLTLAFMSLILGAIFLGLTWLAVALGVRPTESETVVSLLSRSVFGQGGAYYFIQASTALILVLAANTSFSGFPSLSSVIAKDGFLPRQLALRGDRLVYSNGIVVLAVIAAALVALFKGDVHALMPLYAIGVFLGFTLSQAGMVRFWVQRRSPGRAAVNALGAVATGVVLAIVASTKFASGAWVVLVLLPVFVLVMHGIHRHYAAVQQAIARFGLRPVRTDLEHLVVVPVAGLHEGTVRAVEYARSVANARTVAVTSAVEPERMEALRAAWRAWSPGVPLVVLDSPFRSVVEPLLDYVAERRRESPGATITVVVPELVPQSLGAHALHNQTALLLKAALRFDAGDVVVTTVPLHV